MKTARHLLECDILVIGSGIAGLQAAASASTAGMDTLLVSKASVGKANNTILAGGAFACATEDFSAEAHIEKTISAGRLLNHRQLVERFARRAPAKIMELRNMGLPGYAHKTGYHCRSSMLVGGPSLAGLLVERCRMAGSRFLQHVMVTDLITDGDTCGGAACFDKDSGEIYGIRSGAVVLATGGSGAVYAQHDNAPGSTGDGYALALEAGLELIDMEFVQFYPLAHAGRGRGHMILPAVFGDLGKIVNRRGEDIKEKYDLRDKPVAIVSRDRLSQAMFTEIMEGNGVDDALLLDLRNADETKMPFSEDLKTRFQKKIGYRNAPVKIIPACHHTMGGVLIDVEAEAGLKGLFAAGEVVGGIHGANRMGGNALSEALVFGETAANSACAYAQASSGISNFEALTEDILQKRFGAKRSGTSTAAVQLARLKDTLWKHAGIVRTGRQLDTSIRQLDEISDALKSSNASTPQDLCRLLEAKNAALTGKAISLAALKRKESRGSHFRKDFPSEDPNWEKHIHIGMPEGRLQLTRVEPVKI